MATDFTSYVYGCDYQAGSQYQSLKTCSSASLTLTGGYRYNSNNWVMMFKFQMPANASSITLSLCTIAGANNGAQATMKYKFYTSQQSSPNYTSSTSADGTVTIKNSSSSITRNNLTFTRSFTKGTTYYLYFWTAQSTSNTSNLMRVRWYGNSDGNGCYATYEPAVTKYTVTINQGEGTTLTVKNGNTTISSGTSVESGTQLTISATASTGYNTPTIKVNNSNFTSGNKHTVTAATTITSSATKKTYTVSYNANGGSGAPSSQTKTHGTALTLSTTKPTKTNTSTSYTVTFNGNGGTPSKSSDIATTTTTYTFSKWNTNSGGTGTSYNSGASYTTDAAVTLYAQYTSSTSGGSITTATASRAGYAFKGWATSSTATSASIGGNASYAPTGNVTLYAVWEVNQYTLTISAGTGTSITVKNGNTILSSGAIINNSDNLTISIIANEGYVLKTRSHNNGTYTVSGNITVSATARPRCISIGNGSSFDKYTVYIGNGTTYDAYVVYIGNGSSWELYGE